MAGRDIAPECPIRRPKSSARISERRSEFNGGGLCPSIGFGGQTGWSGRKMLAMRRGNAHAIAASHQHAILGSAQIRNAHGEPYSDRRQRDGKREGCDVRQHAMAKIVRLIPVALIARQIIRLLQRVFLLNLPSQISPLTRRMGQGARPEFEHAMLFLRLNGPLGFHCCQLRDILVSFSTPATRLTENVDVTRIRLSRSAGCHGTGRSQS
jgi:hypothetical protein